MAEKHIEKESQNQFDEVPNENDNLVEAPADIGNEEEVPEIELEVSVIIEQKPDVGNDADEDSESDEAVAPAAKRAKTTATAAAAEQNFKLNTLKEIDVPHVSKNVPIFLPSTKMDTNLRKFHRIPVFVVDYHNDVLEFLYRCLGSRHLPLENNILVHFDSHPDMVISRELAARASYNKETMLAELSIENWIMPVCYAGHFNRVVWLKNSWCQQMPVGTYNYKIGEKDNLISVNLPLDYFIAEGNYSDTEQLLYTRDMQLHVCDADSDKLDPNDFLKPSDAQNFILDIDLDFFSTSNPFLEIYKDANCYEHLREIFYFETAAKSSNVRLTTERRLRQLEALKMIFTQLEEKRTFESVILPTEDVLDASTVAKVRELYNILTLCYSDDEIDWLLIYDSGSTTDCNGLPNHVSTPAELEEYFERFRAFLKKLPIPPVAITMACSAEDDYCPQNQVNFIQDKVLSLLTEAFGNLLHEKPILHYMDDEWDIMQL